MKRAVLAAFALSMLSFTAQAGSLSDQMRAPSLDASEGVDAQAAADFGIIARNNAIVDNAAWQARACGFRSERWQVYFNQAIWMSVAAARQHLYGASPDKQAFSRATSAEALDLPKPSLPNHDACDRLLADGTLDELDRIYHRMTAGYR